MKKFFTLIAVAAMAFAAQANILTVAEGTDEALYVPFYGFMMDTQGSISQVIYPADMLAEMNGGTISEVKFYPTEAFGALGSGNLQISLNEVEQDRYTSTTLVTGGTVVANAYPVQGDTEWVIVFDTPFEYHGGNLMIETYLTQEGSFKSTKFFGQKFSYAIGLAQYSYSWSTNYSYETEFVLPKATFTFEKGDTPEPQGLRGDVDGDDKVSIDDVTALIDYLLGTNPDINTDNADCDLDDAILIDDVTTLIDFLLTGAWPE
jgi:hypothetical protein